MIIAEVHPDEAMKLAAQVAAATVLLQIQPRRIRMDSKLKPTFPEEITHLAATFKQETGNFELRENDRLLDVQVGIDIRLFASSKEVKDQATISPDNWSVKIELLFVLTYVLPPSPIPTNVRESGLAAFAKVNARLACWPYIRHQANHLASELGIPFVMPTLVLRPDQGTKSKRTTRTSSTKSRELGEQRGRSKRKERTREV